MIWGFRSSEMPSLEEMAKIKEEWASKVDSDLELEKEETFREYIEDLKLTPEDFNKKILDIGSGEGEFAAWAKEHGVSDNIYSLDSFHSPGNSKKGVRGDAEKLPFKDESFDMVISHGSMPMLLHEKKDPKMALRNTISEMLRVVKENGEIRLAPIADWKTIDVLREHVKNFAAELGDLEKDGKIEIEKISLGKVDYGKLDGMIEHFLYKIKKKINVELPQKIEKEESKENIELLPYFPTDLERAKAGVKKFNEVFENSEVFRKATEEEEHKKLILYSVVGFYPEAGFYWALFENLNSDEERDELKKIFEEEFNLRLINWDSENKWNISLLNSKSAEKVIKNCPIPDLFPAEAENESDWAEKNPLEWVDGELKESRARFGVMSGYPPHAANIYKDFMDARDILENLLSEEEQKEYKQYSRSDRRTRTLSENLNNKINKAVEEQILTNEQAHMIKNRFRLTGDLESFGDGFFDEDEKYFDNVKKILEIII